MSSMPSSSRAMEEKRAAYAPPKAKSRRKIIIFASVVGIIIVIAAVIIPVYLFVLKPSNNSKDNSNDSASDKDHTNGSGTATSSAATPTTSAIPVTGGDGTLITMDDGTTFKYQNSFGGTWYFDENDPFNNGAQAQSWTPALNETFNYGVDKIRGCVSVYLSVFLSKLGL